MTLQEAKEQIAKKYTVDLYNLTVWMSDEAAELYARSKWDEACEAMRYEIQFRYIEQGGMAMHTPKPQFKP